ncbi:MAG TPA: YaaR family protein [Clostridiaceae bacterium]|nr:YaaR family protein [Clostridiaceae bacterium]
MKVESTIGNTANIKKKIVPEGLRTSDTHEKSFQVSLKHAQTLSGDDKIKELAEKIFEQGKKVGDKVDIKELKYYKKLVSEFLYEVINGTCKFSKQSFLDRRGRHRVYAIIKKINRELELLAEDVLGKEKNNIRVLKRLDDIRGLILDIIM